MPYVTAETAARAARGAATLRGALDGTRTVSPAVTAALDDRDLRLWLETWVMPGLDELREAVER